MNYQKVYDAICARGNAKLLSTGHFKKDKPFGWETHHIKPRCMGGSNKRANLAWLTAKEHFIAHLLLTKMYPNNTNLADAAFRMSTVTRYGKINSRIASQLKSEKANRSSAQLKALWQKESFRQAHADRMATPTFKAGASERMKNRMQTEGGKANALKGSLKAGAVAKASGQAHRQAVANLAVLNSDPVRKAEKTLFMHTLNSNKEMRDRTTAAVIAACAKAVRLVETGEVFYSAKEAARTLSTRLGITVNQSPISKVVRGESLTAYGFRWCLA